MAEGRFDWQRSLKQSISIMIRLLQTNFPISHLLTAFQQGVVGAFSGHCGTTLRCVDSSMIYLLRELLGLCRDALLVRRVNLSEVQTFVSTFLKLSLQSLCLISRSSDMMDVVEVEETLLMFELKPKMCLLLLRLSGGLYSPVTRAKGPHHPRRDESCCQECLLL